MKSFATVNAAGSAYRPDVVKRLSRTDPLLASRTNFVPRWLHWWMFPHNVSCHIEHHLYPSVPFYILPECHREMTPRGILANTEVRKLAETRAMIAVDPPGIG